MSITILTTSNEIHKSYMTAKNDESVKLNKQLYDEQLQEGVSGAAGSAAAGPQDEGMLHGTINYYLSV